MRPNIACRSCRFDVLLELHEAVGHRVEGVAELSNLVASAIVTRASSCPSRDGRVARVSAKMRVMNDRPQSQPSDHLPSSARPMAASS